MTKYTLPSLSSKFHYDVLISYRRKRSKLHHFVRSGVVLKSVKISKNPEKKFKNGIFIYSLHFYTYNMREKKA